MRRLCLGLLLLAGPARALDVCPVYQPVHDRDVVRRIRSGVPFKLLSIAADDHGTFRRIVRVEFDLWNETLTVDSLGSKREVIGLKEAAQTICRALSFPEATSKSGYEYRLLLNPVLGDGLKYLKEGDSRRSGLLRINWQRLIKDLETESVLVEAESLK